LPQVLKNLQRESEPELGLIETVEEITGGLIFPLNRFSVEGMERFTKNYLLFVNSFLKNPEGNVADVVLYR
jgi:hypothetical protein